MFDWSPWSEKQLSVIDPSNWRYLNVLDGSVRAGKTVAEIVAWVNYVSTYAPVGKLAMVGKTERTLKRNLLDPMQDMFGDSLIRLNCGAGEAYIAGRKIDLYGANDAKAADKVKGATWAGVCFDEGTTYPQDFFNMAMSRLSVPGALAFMTTNPDSPFHYLYTDYLQNPELQGDIRRWQFVLDDNYHLTEEYKDRLKRQYAGLFYKRYIEGLWVASEGAIYGGLLTPRHEVTRDQLPPMSAYYIGADYAISAPTAYILLGVGVDSCLYCLKEYYYSGEKTGVPKTVLELTQDLIGFSRDIPVKRIYIDPSATPLIIQLRRSQAIPVRTGKERIVRTGIGIVSALLSTYHIKIVSALCPNLLMEMGSYVWDEKAALVGEDKPKKVNDHLLDALRYAIMGIWNTWRPWLGDAFLCAELDEEE